jgi:hypothetical protein
MRRAGVVRLPGEGRSYRGGGAGGGGPVADLAVAGFDVPPCPVSPPGLADGRERRCERADQRLNGVRSRSGGSWPPGVPGCAVMGRQVPAVHQVRTRLTVGPGPRPADHSRPAQAARAADPRRPQSRHRQRACNRTPGRSAGAGAGRIPLRVPRVRGPWCVSGSPPGFTSSAGWMTPGRTRILALLSVGCDFGCGSVRARCRGPG